MLEFAHYSANPWHSAVEPNFTDHQHWTRPLCDRDRQESSVTVSEHRQSMDIGQTTDGQTFPLCAG